MNHMEKALKEARRREVELTALVELLRSDVQKWLDMDDCECDCYGHVCGRTQLEAHVDQAKKYRSPLRWRDHVRGDEIEPGALYGVQAPDSDKVIFGLGRCDEDGTHRRISDVHSYGRALPPVECETIHWTDRRGHYDKHWVLGPIVLPKPGPVCVQCGRLVEAERECYALPTCFMCLPPPEPLEAIDGFINEAEDAP